MAAIQQMIALYFARNVGPQLISLKGPPPMQSFQEHEIFILFQNAQNL